MGFWVDYTISKFFAWILSRPLAIFYTQDGLYEMEIVKVNRGSNTFTRKFGNHERKYNLPKKMEFNTSLNQRMLVYLEENPNPISPDLLREGAIGFNMDNKSADQACTEVRQQERIIARLFKQEGMDWLKILAIIIPLITLGVILWKLA